MNNIIENEEDLKTIVLNIRTVAVIGMKNEKSLSSPAFYVPALLKQKGIRIIPVNPTIEEALGEKAWPNIATVKETYDTINVFRRSDALLDLVDDILALPNKHWPHVVWMQVGVQNTMAAEKLTEQGILVVMNRCLGVYVKRYR